MRTIVIYHRTDFDGIFCREIARKFLPADTEFIGWDYGDPVPNVPEVCHLYILDLSVDCLMDHGGLVWIDHHKSAIEKYPRSIAGYRIDGVSACRLAWQWFNKGKAGYAANVPSTAQPYIERRVTEPMAVRLAGEYDIWDKRDPDANTFQFGLKSRELGPYEWRMLLSDEVDKMLAGTGMEQTNSGLICASLLNDGRLLQRYQRERDASVVLRAFTQEFEGLKFLCLNTTYCNSLTFEAACRPDHDGLMGFYWDGFRWKVSLYHSPFHKEHDLSAIAVKFGGGGHPGACGFLVNDLPFLAPR